MIYAAKLTNTMRTVSALLLRTEIVLLPFVKNVTNKERKSERGGREFARFRFSVSSRSLGALYLPIGG